MRLPQRGTRERISLLKSGTIVMKIRQIRLRNFKRFTDTTINDIPETARLVMLVGPNGCGKFH